ncbi:hypothetical protein [Burkholderia pseudomallei]|uniref:hypothetical protein n=1 Tax=Burkholderia pseudomallei TaxID=28450 RepID=UPI001E4D571B|nr:hypothetical protein [Burkholderia pseudomallei]MCW0011523.1 hypothetical protein [Burkholderia pseudomallei]MCW0064017.1 hypothetical protein [Burkholderia pseudomallei]
MLITAIITITGIDARIGAGHGSAAPPAAAKLRRVARRARRFSHMAIGAANADTHRRPPARNPEPVLAGGNTTVRSRAHTTSARPRRLDRAPLRRPPRRRAAATIARAAPLAAARPALRDPAHRKVRSTPPNAYLIPPIACYRFNDGAPHPRASKNRSQPSS